MIGRIITTVLAAACIFLAAAGYLNHNTTQTVVFTTCLVLYGLVLLATFPSKAIRKASKPVKKKEGKK